jgi:hypothetical protein
MQRINSHSFTPLILPPAFAEGAETQATVQSRCRQNTFVDAAPCDDPQTQGWQALWRAVISQQIMDAKSLSHKPEQQQRKKEAMDWLFHNDSDFTMVCDLAGWEPDYVRSLCITAHSHAFSRVIQGNHL